MLMDIQVKRTEIVVRAWNHWKTFWEPIEVDM
jgi:hypothetical protein